MPKAYLTSGGADEGRFKPVSVTTNVAGSRTASAGNAM